MFEYLYDVKAVVDELVTIDNLNSDRNVVRQILISMSCEYNIFCTALKVQPKLLTFEELKARLLQEEREIEQASGFHLEGATHPVMFTNAFAGQHSKEYGRGHFEPTRKGLLPIPSKNIAQ